MLGEDADGLAVEVTTTKILDVDVRAFRGHVFTLETDEGWFTAHEVIAKNCRCTVIYDEAGTEYGDDLHVDV